MVQYDATAAQASYDTAIRNLNKVGRQIQFLQTYGVQMPQADQGTQEGMDNGGVTPNSPTNSQSVTYNQQLQDLNDAYANVQAEVTKAQQLLNQTVITSKVSGRVVEVNHGVDPSLKNS